jgi:site-specific recombinase XerD
MTAQGKPMSPYGFSNWFADCAKKAGLPEHSSPHGLRKAAARRLAEAGCSTLEIMSITGHQSLREVERYTASVSQKRLAQSAVDRIANG